MPRLSGIPYNPTRWVGVGPVGRGSSTLSLPLAKEANMPRKHITVNRAKAVLTDAMKSPWSAGVIYWRPMKTENSMAAMPIERT